MARDKGKPLGDPRETRRPDGKPPATGDKGSVNHKHYGYRDGQINYEDWKSCDCSMGTNHG